MLFHKIFSAALITCSVLSSAQLCAKARKHKSYVREQFVAKDFKQLSVDELLPRIEQHIADREYRFAAVCVERALVLAKDAKVIRNLRLQLAECWQKAGRSNKAVKAYREFLAQYPNDSQAEYVRYRLIRILFAAMPVCDRDQSGTREAVQLAQAFLANPNYQVYRNTVSEMLNLCRRQLFDSEIKVFEFYLQQQKKPSVARRRLTEIEQAFPEFKSDVAAFSQQLSAVEAGQPYVAPADLARLAKKQVHKFKPKF